ncbi:MAG TPA: DUF2239 family protein, partial [Chroococcales cyanobacterium]
MSGNAVNSCTAFLEDAIVAEGLLTDVAVALRHQFGTVNKVGYLIFDDTNGSQIDFDLRGNDEEILERVRRAFAPPAAPPEVGPDEQPGAETRTGPGRPKLGVVAREVTLLPRH